MTMFLVSGILIFLQKHFKIIIYKCGSADKIQHSPTNNSEVPQPAHVIVAGWGTVDTPHYRRIECGAVERAGSRDSDATIYTR